MVQMGAAVQFWPKWESAGNGKFQLPRSAQNWALFRCLIFSGTKLVATTLTIVARALVPFKLFAMHKNSHIVHLCGLSSQCIFLWLFRWSGCIVLYSHWLQLGSFCPVCFVICLLKLEASFQEWLHCDQVGVITELRNQKFHPKPIPRIFFATKYFREQYWDFFETKRFRDRYWDVSLRQNFLDQYWDFFEAKSFGTDSETFF